MKWEKINDRIYSFVGDIVCEIRITEDYDRKVSYKCHIHLRDEKGNLSQAFLKETKTLEAGKELLENQLLKMKTDLDGLILASSTKGDRLNQIE